MNGKPQWFLFALCSLLKTPSKKQLGCFPRGKKRRLFRTHMGFSAPGMAH